MTLDQLEALTEDELILALYVVRDVVPPIVEPQHLTWLRKGALERRIGEVFNQLKKEAHPTFSSLLHKLDVEHEIRYEQPPAQPTGSL